jgi:hypothetical protein
VTIDLGLCAERGESVRVGGKTLLEARGHCTRELASKGYKTLPILGYRTKDGHVVPSLTVDMSKYLLWVPGGSHGKSRF